MTFSLALPKSLDSLSLVASLQGENAQKNATSEGTDGFAELLNQLSSFIPAAPEGLGAEEGGLQERQILELPTGKDLPLAAFGLPVLVPELPAEGEIAGFTAIDASMPSAISVPVSVAGPSPRFVRQAEGAITTPVLTVTAANPAEIQLGNEATKLAATPEVAGDEPAAGVRVRIAAAQEPRDAKLAGQPLLVEGGKARTDMPAETANAMARATVGAATQGAARPIDGSEAAAVTKTDMAAAGVLHGKLGTLPAAQSIDGERAVQAKLVAENAAQATPTKTGAAALASAPAIGREMGGERQALRSDRADLAVAAKRKPTVTEVGANKADAARSMASAIDPAKSVLHHVATLSADAGAGVSPAGPATAPRTAVTDQFANVERVVDQLMAARQVDLAKPTAIAVAHKEFGTLTVSFDQSPQGVKVEVAAEDSEAHRALAAAMANDRNAGRQQEGAPLPASFGNQAGHTSTERGAASGQSGAGLGHGGGDEHRSQNSDQRSRQGERAANAQQQQRKPSSPDDALYA